MSRSTRPSTQLWVVNGLQRRRDGGRRGQRPRRSRRCRSAACPTWSWWSNETGRDRHRAAARAGWRRRGVGGDLQAGADRARRRSPARALAAANAPTSAIPAGRRSTDWRWHWTKSRLQLEAAGAQLALTTIQAAGADAARAAAPAGREGRCRGGADRPAAGWHAGGRRRGEAAGAQRRPKPPTHCARPIAARNLLHLLPSERMRADALAQTLAAQRWTQVLLLAGPSADDAPRVAAAAGGDQALRPEAGRHASRSSSSADPRERDLANPLLLTGRASYDVVWVVDSDGEFARALPYRTALPRPVVGDGGLAALAWHAQFERFGAPQVSRRFAKAAPAADDRPRLGRVDGRQGAGGRRGGRAERAAAAHCTRRSPRPSSTAPRAST